MTRTRLLMFAASVIALAQGEPGIQAQAAVPRDSDPQYLPCPDQPKSFEEFSRAFAAGRLPSPSEVSGSWALLGIWVHKDSRPDLNCKGITRGGKLVWIDASQKILAARA